MLGQEVMRAGDRAGSEMFGVSHGELDITDGAGIEQVLGAIEPDAVLNCAAWTDVDGAQRDPAGARAINRDGAGSLAVACAAAGARMLHVSTDYVFDGLAPLDEAGAPRAYLERDPPGPRTAYGAGKLEGETLVLRASRRHTVVRTAWLFGLGGRNFTETMLRLAAEGGQVRVVADQVGCPTWTGHLAPALLGLLERDVTGLVHLAGGGAVSWNGFAVEIFRQAELDCEALAVPLPPWQDGLAGYLAARAGMMRG
jgi:dTDP-4-dehydrorhamnose reductase